MNKPTCATCAYFDGRAEACSRYPPTVISLDHATRWPEVGPDQWCGEHQDFPAYLQSLNRHLRGHSLTLREALEKHCKTLRAAGHFRTGEGLLTVRAYNALNRTDNRFLDQPLHEIEARDLQHELTNFGDTSRLEFEDWRRVILGEKP